jgi:hypothetical protein
MKELDETNDVLKGYWTRYFVAFKVEEEYLQLVFELKLSFAGYGSVGIDNVKFTSCSVCTFESGLCGWVIASDTGYTPWLNNSGSTLSHDTGPSYDHTYGVENTLGHYLYVEASTAGKETSVLKQTINASENICSLLFAYHMYGSHTGSLTVSVEVSSNRTVVWQELGDHGDKWQMAAIALGENLYGKTVELVITAETLASGFRSDIAIDDVELRPCAATGLCAFTQDSCSWKNDEGKQLQWKMSCCGMVFSSSNTMVANFSSPNIPNGSHASLRGPSLFSGDDLCSLRLFYEVTGQLHNSKLQLVFVNSTGGQFVQANFTVRGQMISRIMEVSVLDLSVFPVIYAEKANGENGTVIIHGLEFISCGYTTFETDPKDITWQDKSVSNSSHWMLRLSRRSQPITSQTPAIKQDHTYQQYNRPGHYMLHVSNSTIPATLITTVTESKVCGIRFWYYIAKRQSHKLEVSLTFSGQSSSKTLFGTKGEKAIPGSWTFKETASAKDLHKAVVSLTSNRGSTMTPWTPFALDDIELTKCPDFSTCTFESGLCGWTFAQDSSHGAIWLRLKGPPPHKPFNLTNFDSSARGYYLYMAMTNDTDKPHSGVLQGIPIRTGLDVYAVCGISFWYYIHGNASLTLTFRSEMESTDYVVYPGQTAGSKQSGTVSWRSVQVKRKTLVKNVGHVEFHAVAFGTNDVVTVALDDVTYISCTGIPLVTVKPPHTSNTKSVTTTQQKSISRTSQLQPTGQTSTTRSLLPTTPQYGSHGSHSTFNHLTSQPAGSPSSDRQQSSKGGLTVPVVIGGVVAIVGLLAVGVCVAVLLYKRRSSSTSRSQLDFPPLAVNPLYSKTVQSGKDNVYCEPFLLKNNSAYEEITDNRESMGYNYETVKGGERGSRKSSDNILYQPAKDCLKHESKTTENALYGAAEQSC